jgi:hypothetical protein
MSTLNLIVFTLFVVLLLLLLLLILLLFYGEHLRRSKEIIGGGLKMMLPSQFDDKLKLFSKNIKDLENGIKNLIIQENKVKKDLEDSNKSSIDAIGKTNKSFSIFGEAIDKFEKELNFYKKGAEKNYLEKFWKKFVKFRDYIQEQESNPENNDQTREVLRSLLEIYDDGLQDFDVLMEYPRVGMNFKECACVAEKPEVKATDNPAKDFQIFSIQTPAFYNIIGDKINYISKAKVTIFRYKGDSNG